MKKILLLGASGSIGKQTLDVIEKNPQDFVLTSFSVGYHTRSISSILRKHKSVKYIYLIDKKKRRYYQKRYSGITFESSLTDLVKHADYNMAVNALVGFSGLLPSIEVLKRNKKLALANKESLVVGGELIDKLLKSHRGKLYPIDSEHSALWKCLKVDDTAQKLVLTASGGAFRHLKRSELGDVKAADALKHPTWKMGKKITIDCATMINKCFEIIEAGYLYHFPVDRIGVTLHDESYLHSYVVYENGLCRGELNKPDMRNPIKFALYEGEIPFDTVSFFDLRELKHLHFHEFDPDRYPMVSYSKTVLNEKGTYGAVLNASNEVAVNAFLNDEIAFLDIERIVTRCMKEHKNKKNPTISDLVKVDSLIREKAYKMVSDIKGGTFKW